VHHKYHEVAVPDDHSEQRKCQVEVLQVLAEGNCSFRTPSIFVPKLSYRL
ncbi:hypothetical protein A2U01_0045040, partial [Trifolium medium]|nr:hypothetical protein [Trifolium medium]